MKTKRKFVTPQLRVVEAGLEGLICESKVGFFLQADELQNMNVTQGSTKHDGPGTEHYFEF